MIGTLRSISNTQLESARFIYQFFKEKGWSCESIAGMLGNIQAESGVIADIDERSGGGGYGLVQWTPKSKLTDWADKNRFDHRTLEAQCQRILWELENSYQFYATSKYPLTFKEFVKRTDSPDYLAMVFLHNYERPANLNQPARGDYANDWYELLVVRNGGSGGADTSNTTDTSSGTGSTSTSNITYTVKKGDTLSAIALKFNTTVSVLQALNGIKDVNKISVGQVLKLKSETSTSSTYTVKKGDTLSAISLKFNTTVSALQALNSIKDINKISVGQVLKISNINTYTVKKGDTLSTIASKFNTTASKLQTLNNIKDINKIFVGDVLKVK